MRAHIVGVLVTVTALTVLRKLTHAVPAPSNVSVTCDSYGVVVAWTATNLSEKADFLLEVKPDFGQPEETITKYRWFDISDLLLDTAYNRYFVKVTARDGGNESDFAESQIFSFNSLTTANIHCDLEFPRVELVPRDGNLFVKFANPLHLYRDTPALRNLNKDEGLKYYLISNKTSKDDICSPDVPVCESSVSFPEEQGQYCITLKGSIRLTNVQETERYCYSGTLNPGPPVINIVIPVLGVFAAFVLLALATWFLVNVFTKQIKKKSLSSLPQFLEDILTHTPLITPFSETVAKNPQVEPASETSTQLETATNSDDFAGGSLYKSMYESSGSSNATSASLYGNGAELSSSEESSGYDRGHMPVEMSPGDVVKSYWS